MGIAAQLGRIRRWLPSLRAHRMIGRDHRQGAVRRRTHPAPRVRGLRSQPPSHGVGARARCRCTRMRRYAALALACRCCWRALLMPLIARLF